jgi:hypothetical protein
MSDALLASLAVGGFVVAVIALLLALGLALRVRRTGAAGGQAGSADPSVERLLATERQRIDSLGAELAGVAEHLRRIEAQGQRAMTRVGIVRFNPFEDTGGNQSFALALLDRRSDGLVISSLHSRQQTRVYLKAIRGGEAESALSDEESEALRRATQSEGHPSA